MRKWKATIAVMTSLLWTTLVAAAPTIYGPTGLITMPTAEAVQYKEFSFGLDYLSISGPPKDESWFYKMNVGTYKNWELGIVGGKVPTEGVFVNVKYYLTTEAERFPIALAVGFQNLFSKERTDLYMVASKRFPSAWSGHLGFKANFGRSKVQPSVMGGLEYALSEHVSTLGDITSDGDQYSVNAGLRIVLIQNTLLNLAVTNIGQSTGPGTAMVVGFSYSTFL
jgi:hypothetical protein